MEKQQENINLRGEEIQEILGRVPNWITRFGSLFILIAILCVIAVAAIVKYPDIVSAPVTLSSSRPPIPLYTKQAGNIEQFYVQNNQAVQAGEVLAVMQNSAQENDILSIEVKLDSFITYPSLMGSIDFPLNAEIGRIQGSYGNFLSSLESYEFFESQNVGSSSIGHIQAQIGQLNQINSGLEKQNQHCYEELQILNKNYYEDLDLFNKGVISQREVDKSLTAYTQKKSDCESLNIQISNNQLKIQELNLEKFGYSSDDKQSSQSNYMTLKENANQLASEIQLWKEQFLLIAPVDGYVSLNDVWSELQFVTENQEVLTIVQSKNDLKIFAQVASKDIAKVKLNQAANIRLDAYNYLEYGLIQGKIISISPVPRDNVYQVEILLDNGLYTTYNKTLSFTQGMEGLVEIVSQKRTFLSRIFDKFKFLFSDKYE